MNSIKGFYPVILIPDSIRQFCANNPIPVLLENAPLKIQQPFPPRLPVFNNSRYYLVIQFWIASFVVVILVNWRFSMSVIAFWSSLVCASISAVAAFCYLRFVDFQVRDRYNQRVAEYERQLAEYESYQLRRVQSKGKESEEYISLLRKRSKLLESLLKKIFQPSAV